ncbi:MAG: type II secretion system protein [Phycisphaerales bacterium]|nr:type II secretion system protein [Phycisphaerales bacterium]
MRNRRSTSTRTRRGFTLVEAAVSIVIVGVMLTAAISMLGSSARTRRQTALWREGESIARALMAEVQQSGYGATSGLLSVVAIPQGADRTRWRTVDEYNGLTEGPPTDRTGAPLPGYPAWRRSVQIERVDPTNPGGAGRAINGDTGLKRITVVVVAPGGQRTTLVALRSRWGLVESGGRLPGVVLAGLNIGIASGPGGRVMFSGVSVPNNTSESGRVSSLPTAGGTVETESLLGGIVGGVGDALRGLFGGGGG